MRLTLLVVSTLGCQGTLMGPGEIEAMPDSGPIVVSLDGGSPTEEIDAGPPAILLAPDLRVDRVDLFQSVRVPIVVDGVAADRDELPIVAGREALVRIHAEALDGWTPRAITAVLEIEGTRFTDTRVSLLPADVS